MPLEETQKWNERPNEEKKHASLVSDRVIYIGSCWCQFHSLYDSRKKGHRIDRRCILNDESKMRASRPVHTLFLYACINGSHRMIMTYVQAFYGSRQSFHEIYPHIIVQLTFECRSIIQIWLLHSIDKRQPTDRPTKQTNGWTNEQCTTSHRKMHATKQYQQRARERKIETKLLFKNGIKIETENVENNKAIIHQIKYIKCNRCAYRWNMSLSQIIKYSSVWVCVDEIPPTTQIDSKNHFSLSLALSIQLT